MTQSSRPDRLQDILDAYVAATPQPDLAALKDWISRYPEYQQELTAFTASWSMTDILPPSPDVGGIAQDELLARGHSVVGRVLSTRDSSRLANSLPANIAEPARDDAPAGVKQATE